MREPHDDGSEPIEIEPTAIYVAASANDAALAARIDTWPHATRLDQADVLVCLIGEDTYRDAAVLDAITRARIGTDPNRRPIGLVGVMLAPYHLVPDELKDCGAIVVPFKRDKVEHAVRWAANEPRPGEDFTLADE